MKIKNILLAFLLVFFVAGCSINIGTKEEPVNEPATEEKESNNNDGGVVNEADAKISLAKAKQIALDHVNLSKNDVQFIEAYLEMDDGVLQYDIEFRHNNISHEFEIDANSGKIISYDMDND